VEEAMPIVQNMSIPRLSPQLVRWNGPGIPLEHFRVFLRYATEEYFPHPLVAAQMAIRQRMLMLLNQHGSALVQTLQRVVAETRRTSYEQVAWIAPTGVVLAAGHGVPVAGAHTSPVPPRPAGAIGFVHSHPVGQNLIAPPSGGDWHIRDADFALVPLQFVVEMNCRVWGVLEGGFAILLGYLTNAGFSEVRDPSTGFAYSIVSGQRVIDMRAEEERAEARALSDRLAGAMSELAAQRRTEANRRRAQFERVRLPLRAIDMLGPSLGAGARVETPIPSGPLQTRPVRR